MESALSRTLGVLRLRLSLTRVACRQLVVIGGMAAAGFSSSASAQQPTLAIIEGRVIDTSDARVAEARVELIGVAETTTDVNGVYRLKELAGGTYLLRVQRLGYTTALKTLTLSSGERLRLDFELMPSAPQLPAVKVTESASESNSPDASGFEYRRMHNAGGAFLSEEDIVRRHATATEQLFQMMKSVQITNGVIHVARGKIKGGDLPTEPGARRIETRCEAAAVFVNGAIVRTPFDINTIAVSSIKAIEFYPGPATLPPAFRSAGTVCGTVLIWQK